MNQFEIEIPTSFNGGLKVTVLENILSQGDFWHSVNENVDINIFRQHYLEGAEKVSKWRYVLYPVEDGQTITNIIIDSGYALEPKKVIMSEEKKKPLEQAVEIVNAALEKIKALEDVEKPVNEEKLSKAIRDAYLRGMIDAAQQVENMSIDIRLEEGGFEYNYTHDLCDFVSVEDNLCFEDDADTWINSSAAQRIEKEFYNDDVS
jgi:hypothetical protein